MCGNLRDIVNITTIMNLDYFVCYLVKLINHFALHPNLEYSVKISANCSVGLVQILVPAVFYLSARPDFRESDTFCFCGLLFVSLTCYWCFQSYYILWVLFSISVTLFLYGIGLCGFVVFLLFFCNNFGNTSNMSERQIINHIRRAYRIQENKILQELNFKQVKRHSLR